MSQGNLDLIRSFYADPDPWSSFATRVAPEAEFDFTAIYPDVPVLRGMEEVRRFFDELPWASLKFEPERIIELDSERVIVLVRASGVGKLSGVAGEVRVAHEFTIRGGLLARFKVYDDRDKALEAAGLRE